MAKICLKNVTKKFGPVEVLQGINLEIANGSFVVFVGPSGCGKTTLLRIIAGLESQSAGDVYIGDRLVNEISPKDRNVAMVFQNYALYPHMTAKENILFGLKLRKVPKDEQERSLKKIAAMLEIENLLDRKPRELSGGQRQRVAMARAIVRNPEVFLMDEPLSNLDAKLRTQMRGSIKKLQKTLKTTTIYVTHDQLEAMAMADKIAVLNKGKIEQYDLPANVYNKPANVFVADFIGTMNFFSATQTDEAKFQIENQVQFVLPINKRINLKSRKYLLGIRPEHVFLLKQELPSETKPKYLTWESKVNLAELIGGETLIYTRLGSHELKVKTNQVIREGQTIKLGFDLSNVHFFEPSTGKRIELNE